MANISHTYHGPGTALNTLHVIPYLIITMALLSTVIIVLYLHSFIDEETKHGEVIIIPQYHTI